MNDKETATPEHERQMDQYEEEKVQIPLSEFDLLQSCQKIIDAASSMQCI
jgi:hypothetical protein